MILNTNLCLFGCVILLSSLLNNIDYVMANANPTVKEVDKAAGGDDAADASMSRAVDRMKKMVSANNNETPTELIPQQRRRDDRLYFELPAGFKKIESTTTHTATVPSRFNEDAVDDDTSFTNNTTPNTINIDGEYNFSVRLKIGVVHAERAEYEIKNGKRVFVIRGYFRNIAPSGELEVSFSPYIFDHTGFHKFPEYYPQLIVDDGGYCDATGEHCMDEKLLAFLAE